MKNPLILVVDDEPVTRIITESVLVRQGFAVRTAASAETALEMLDGGFRPALILLDVIMPGINGFETCRRLRAEPCFTHLPIVMLTALDDQESIDEVYQCGATDFITKPLNMPLLPHRVRYLLRSATLLKDLRESREALISTQKIARLGDWELDETGTLVNCSEQYGEMFGIDKVPLPAEKIMSRVHREDSARLEAARTGLRHGYPYQLDYRLIDNGVFTHVHEVGFPKGKDQGAGAYGYTQDITQRIVAEEQVRNLAWHDPLSGLKNRSRMAELMDREMVDPQGTPLPLNLFFIQVSSLHKVSILFGQPLADATLLALSARLKDFVASGALAIPGITTSLLRQANLGRYDETTFLLSLPGQQSQTCLQQLAEALAATVSEPVSVKDEELLLVPAIGVSSCPTDATDVQELIRCAMHSATLAGTEGASRVVFFDPARDAEAASRHLLERQLRTAICSGDQLLLYFQPKVNAETGTPVGAEVLMRWNHPERGLVSPADFIPIAERSGLIKPMTEWLLAQAVEQIALWHSDGLDPGTISINVSAHSIYGGSLVRQLDDVLRSTGIDGSQLIVEITEGTLVHDREAALQVLNALRERNIGISLDDFGTGYSSLGYLQRFPIDEIKIDRSFVIDVDDNLGNQALVSAIVGLGHALQLSVVAEGVETPSQATRLRHLGCDTLQGYLYGCPMPATEFASFLARSTWRATEP